MFTLRGVGFCIVTFVAGYLIVSLCAFCVVCRLALYLCVEVGRYTVSPWLLVWV